MTAFILTFCFCVTEAKGGDTVPLTGVVTDSVSNEALPYVNVYNLTDHKGVLTDDNGKFTIHVDPDRPTEIQVKSLGYKPFSTVLKGRPRGAVEIRLAADETDLEELVVNPGKYRYSKRNPAVALIKKVREDHGLTDPRKEDFYSYNRYEKHVLGLNDYKSPRTTNKFLSKLQFLKENIDTSLITGKQVLDLSIREKISTRITSHSPEADKEIVTAFRSSGVDNGFEQQTIRAFLEDVSREIDIYSNDIPLMQNRFVSPLSRLAPDIYKFFIRDTVMIGGDRCVEVEFSPHNPASFTFNGKIYVPVGDSVRYVRRITMRVPREINLNYVKDLYISQNFTMDYIGNVHKTLDDLTVELQLVAGTPEIYAHRIIRTDSVSYEPREDLRDYYTRLGSIFQLDEAESRSRGFWDARRMVPLSYAENNLSHTLDKLREIPFFYWAEKVLVIIAKGYIATGKESRFDFGPVNTFISANTTEGLRLRVGGMTTAYLNPHLFARGYVAYGFKDRKWKYEGELEYSFNRKKYHSREFPMHAFRLTHRYDLDMIGQHYLFTNADNIFLSLKRKKSNLVTYRRFSDLTYLLELNNHFSLTASLRHEIQEGTRWLPFTRSDGTTDKSFSQAYVSLTLRYAPNEKFSQGRTSRAPINMDAPVFQITHDFGPGGFAGSKFTLNRTEASVRKRFWLSAFGYIDIMAKGGKIWSSVPYPFLMWPNANLSYTIQPESYSLMNPMEFANDWYGAIDMTYWMNGALFNLIPGFKKLKWREVITFKGLKGGLTKKNNPEYNSSLYRFPMDADTYVMGKTPYMELGVGIDNILTILRIDYIWRLTYRDHPDTDRSGLRVSLHFSF